ncbi:MAG: tetratricopeptide repeat protein, partial [bacterium]
MNCRFVIAALVASVAGVLTASGEISIGDQVQLADGLYDRGMYELAVREYSAVLASTTNQPRSAEVTYRVGESYRQMKRMAKAVEYFANVEATYPSSPFRFKAALRRAEILDGANKTTELFELLDATLAAKPPPDIAASALFLQGAALSKAARKDAAAISYGRIISDYAGTSLYTYSLLALGGLKAAEPGGSEKAIELYRSAAAKPATPRVGAEAWFQIASVYFQDKAYSRSAEAFDKLFELYPADSRIAEARLPRAWALYHSKMPADALRLVEVAMAVPSSNETSRIEELLYLKANCQRQLIKPADAAVTYATLLEKFPGGRYASPAAYERVLSLFKANMFSETVREAKALTSDAANLKDLYWLLAESYLALKDEEGAIQYYRLIMQKCSDSDLAPDAGYRLGHLLQKREEYLPAAEVFSDVAFRYPTNDVAAQALFAAAASRGRAGKQEESVRDFGLLIQKYQASPLAEEARYQKAMGEIVLQRDDQAMASLRELLDKNGVSRFAVESRYWLGVLLDGSGKSQDAEAELRRALVAKPEPELERRVQLQLAIVLQKTGKSDESAGLLIPLVASPAGDKVPLPILSWLAEYHLGKREYGKAADAAMALATRADTGAWKQSGFCLAGRALMEQGRTADARVVLVKALAIQGEYDGRPEAAWRLGEIELLDKDYDGAMKHFEEAAKMASSDGAFAIRMKSYFGIGRLMKARGNNDEAAKYFMSVAVLFDDAAIVPQCLFEAGQLFKQLGRAEESD